MNANDIASKWMPFNGNNINFTYIFINYQYYTFDS